jgi:GTP-binding protein Era
MEVVLESSSYGKIILRTNRKIMTTYCGYIALVGRPNVGKSTLLNRILQVKLSITSRKPQTTRHSILGVQTKGDYQWIYVDTPGIHQNIKKTMNRMMNKTAISVLQDVDAIVFIVDGTHWKPEDEYVLSLIQQTETPCFLVVNKVDKIPNKDELLPFLKTMGEYGAFKAIIPLSAKTGFHVEHLEDQLKSFLPEDPHAFADDQFTDRSTRFLCAELLREKVFRLCGQELPYSTAVEIESFKEEEKLIRIHALIWVDKESHKRMIIGDKGSKLKEIASSARVDMEHLLGQKVFLQCWCKVKSGWFDNERLLKQLGYDH